MQTKKEAMKNALLLFACCLFAGMCTGQQEAMFTHYGYNTLAMNPAYAGSRSAMTFTLLNRSQWVGFEGAPTTQTFTTHTPVAGSKLGLGLSVIQDNIGPTKNTSVVLDAAYRLKLDERSTLSFGLKGGLAALQTDVSQLPLDNPDDPNFLGGTAKSLKPNLGFGMYFSRERWYVGVSTPKIIEHKIAGTSGKQQRHYFAIAGAMLQMTDQVAFRPTTFLKVTTGAPMQLDITGTFVFNNRFWTGAMYRTGDAAGFLAGVNLNEQLAIGYSFDFSFTNTTFTYNLGSHEVMLRYDLIFGNQKRVISPRYF